MPECGFSLTRISVRIYDQLLNVQNKAALAITEDIQGSSGAMQESSEKNYTRYRFRAFASKLVDENIVTFHIKIPKYIHSLILSIRASARQPNTFISFDCRSEYFQNSF